MATPKEAHHMAQIGERLRITREALGLNQDAFSSRAGLHPSAYNQYERGKRLPTVAAAISIADTYDLTLDWIYRGDPSGLKYAVVDAMRAMREAKPL